MHEPIRFAELMACLAAACELAMGQDADHALHVTAVALRLGEARKLAASERRDAYYLAQLRFVGCNVQTDEMAGIGGDVVELRRAMAPLDSTDTRAVVSALLARIRAEHADESAWQRTSAMLQGLLRSGRFNGEFFPGHCEVAQRLGTRLGFGAHFIAGLGQLYARWDGGGVPGVAGETIRPAVRVVTLAHELVIHHRRGGWPAASAMVQQRAGRQFDPTLAALAMRLGASLLQDLPVESAALWALEPEPHESLSDASLDRALAVLADYADIQSPWLLGHSALVARLADAAAMSLQLPVAQRDLLRRAAWLHDVGRVAISADVWGRSGPLSARDRDRIRLHSLHTEQVLSRAPALRPLARLAASAHERLDGAGYPHGSGADALPMSARILAAADIVAALGEPRPQRGALDAAAQRAVIAADVAVGRLCAVASNAVLAAAGLEAVAAPARLLPAGLSEREAEVLGQLARGRTNKEIARRLAIAPKTVGRHLENAYAKVGVRTRAGATLFAMENGLVARD